MFGTACIYNLEAPFSDHFALFLDFLVKRVKKTSRFRFKNAWIKEVECKEFVSSSWAHIVKGNIQDKIVNCSNDVRVWGRKYECSLKINSRNAETELK